jgi:hypothetical protein
MIAKGELKKGKHDYPTMDDVVSDWDSDKEPKDGGKKGAKGKKPDKKAPEKKASEKK